MNVITKKLLAENAHTVFQPYKEKIERTIREAIENFAEKSTLRDACEYALLSGGKRFRPACVHLFAAALNKGKDVAYAAVAIEFFHTASLIADDLPCMDNDDFRRDKPTVHKVFGESTALLASFALIAAGFEYISKNGKEIPALAVRMTLHASRVNGTRELLGGQFLDLNPPELTEAALYEIMEKKTVSLFELAFLLGWAFGGGEEALEGYVKHFAFHFGIAFQLLDDVDDMEQDKKRECRTNFPNLFGKNYTLSRIDNHLQQCHELIPQLGLENTQIHALLGILHALRERFYA